MKRYKILAIALVLSLIAVIPASAQLGESDFSTFTIMNVSDVDAQVEVMFVDEAGATYTPDPLATSAGDKPNPFTMVAGEVIQIIVFNIDDSLLPDGPLSVVLSSSAPVVVNAGVAGTGATRFSGEYSGFATGDTTIYIPSVSYNLYDWFSMISVQNIGGDLADVTMTITCNNNTLVGTLTKTDLPVYASVTWALKNLVPDGFTSSTSCDGSAVITSDQPIVAVNNQNNPLTGSTESFESATEGDTTLYVATLNNYYYDWISALRIRKVDPGNVTVNIDYGMADWDDATCELSDSSPACSKYIWVDQAGNSTDAPSGAKITSADGVTRLLATVGSTKNRTLSSGVLAFTASQGSNTVFAPNVAKYYYGWISTVTCVNVSTTPTQLIRSYEDYESYEGAIGPVLDEGEAYQIIVFQESFLPDNYQGGATITTTDTSAQIACQVGLTNREGVDTGIPGDWSTSFNAFGQ